MFPFPVLKFIKLRPIKKKCDGKIKIVILMTLSVLLIYFSSGKLQITVVLTLTVMGFLAIFKFYCILGHFAE